MPRHASKLTIAGISVVVALLSVIGADCLWAVAVGRRIISTGHIENSVYFASAPTAGWHNVPVLGELIFAVAHLGGLSGILLLNCAAVVLTLGLVCVDGSRAFVSDHAQALALAVGLIAGLPDFIVVRLGLLSLPMFALLTLILRSQHRSPSRHIWWVPVLIAIWGNLHGAVLVGVALTGCYLLLSRLRGNLFESILVGMACLVALFINPQGIGTWNYYRGVMGNVARARGIGLWAPLDFSSPFQYLLVGGIAVLMLGVIRRRPPLWELVAMAGLAFASVAAARYGVWLTLLLTVPAAAGWTSARLPTRARQAASANRAKDRIDRAAALSAAVVVVIAAVARGGEVSPIPPRVVEAVSNQSTKQPVLASDRNAEALAIAGIETLVSDPIDAFSQADQSGYVDFTAGRRSSLTAKADRILIGPHDDAGRLLPVGFRVSQSVDGWRILVRSARP